MTAQPTAAATDDGMEKLYFGAIELAAGMQTMTIAADKDVMIDRIYLTEADELTPAVIIEDESNFKSQ